MENEEKTLQYLRQCGERIQEPDRRAGKAGERHWNSIAKPLHGLGLLEDALIQIAAIQGTEDITLDKKAVVVMCADNGVVAQGVTQTGQEVTAIVAENMSTGDTSVCAMARSAGAEVVPVDIGTAVPLTGARIVQRCVRRGTADMTRGPAMSREEAVQAVLTGVETARELCAGGVHLLATGEMGIGNTTTSSAVAAVLLGQEPVVMTGRGAGLSDAGLQKKIHAIETAVAVNRPDPADVLDVWMADDGKGCRVIVPDDQLSLAIGKEGQNARLAARLTGYKIDIKPESYHDEEEPPAGGAPEAADTAEASAVEPVDAE